MSEEAGAPEPGTRGPLDPPRWMDGFPSLFSSGLFAVAGVMTGISAFLFCVLLAVGIMPVAKALPWILVFGLLAPLLLVLHGRAERYAGIPGGASAPTYLSVAPDRRRSILSRFFGGEETGFLSRDGDGLLLRTRRVRNWAFVVLYLSIRLTRDNPWLFAVVYAGVLTDMILSLTLRRSERLPKEGLTSAILCGDYLVLRLAGSPEPEPLVLRIERFQRARATALLAPHAPFEELPAPRPPRAPRTQATPRTPSSPRPAPAPSTAIDAAKGEALDRALDGMRTLRP